MLGKCNFLAILTLGGFCFSSCSGGSNDEQISDPKDKQFSKAVSFEDQGPEFTKALATTGSTTHSLHARFLKEQGEDIEACFGAAPGMGDGTALDLETADHSVNGPVNRLIIALDASGSMAGQVSGESKMEAAKKAAAHFLEETPAAVEVGLIAFGHKGNNKASGKEKSCSGTENVYPVGASDKTAIARSLDSFSATGWTPLAAAIELAGRSFDANRSLGTQILYVVSDGKETCDGDPVAAARTLNSSNIQAIVNIIGFDLQPADRKQLQAVAKAGGGEFLEVSRRSELDALVAERSRQTRNRSRRNKARLDNLTQRNRNIGDGRNARVELDQCLTSKIVKEQSSARKFRMSTFSSEGRTSEERQSDRKMRRELKTLLSARHVDYRNRNDEFRKKTRDSSKDANERIRAAEQQNEATYEKSR